MRSTIIGRQKAMSQAKRTMARQLMMLVVLLFVFPGAHAANSGHPNLILTKEGVDRIRTNLGSIPIFDKSLLAAKEEVDAEIASGIETPIPKDFSGGYTHERHKRNFFVIQKAGVLFQLLGDEKYARYVRDMLFQYEAMYPKLPLHPQARSYARGKLFWQCLNDANWLVYVSQAYDAVYEWLDPDERQRLETNLFRPFADHLSIDSPQFFNRVHNHSTWGNAAVGMIGLVMGDDELVQRALYGINDDGLAAGAKDDDGGFIKTEGQDAGFFANLAEPFSPDGYYTEGPYYQRYAMYPFLVFAQGLHNARPDLKIFENQGAVLLQAVNALLHLADANGDFFPLNDAQKGMSVQARELVSAVDIAYHIGTRNPQLLSVAQKQGQVLLDDAGFSVAVDIRDGNSEPFQKRSINLADGKDGDKGGVAVLRYGEEALTLVFKYTAQGLSHGHYDKLSYSLYAKGMEVLQDYGMVRLVNVEQKGGGNYLPENASWAKQSIAHNTVVQNETSHFRGEYEVGIQHHSELSFYDVKDPHVQVVSASESNAYPGTELRRTVALIKNNRFEKPFLLDVFQVRSDQANQYDLPFHYQGQVLSTNFPVNVPSTLKPLGPDHGYQHLYLEGTGAAPGGTVQFSWMDNQKFYTISTVSDASDELLFTRLGASDPNFNLRRDPAFIIRRKGADNTVFASVVEAHGSYDPVLESASNSKSHIAELVLTCDVDAYTCVSIRDVTGEASLFLLSNLDVSEQSEHRLSIEGQTYQWSGPFYYASTVEN